MSSSACSLWPSVFRAPHTLGWQLSKEPRSPLHSNLKHTGLNQPYPSFFLLICVCNCTHIQCSVELREPPQGPDFAFHRVRDNRLLFAAVYMDIAGRLAHEHPGIPLTVSPLTAAVLGLLKMKWCSDLSGCWGSGSSFRFSCCVVNLSATEQSPQPAIHPTS